MLHRRSKLLQELEFQSQNVTPAAYRPSVLCVVAWLSGNQLKLNSGVIAAGSEKHELALAVF